MIKPTKTSNLWQRIAWVQENVKTVAKSGYNAHHQYEYAKESDILAVIKPLLTDAGLATTFSTLRSEYLPHGGGMSRVVVALKIVNIDKPEEETTVCGVGDGCDKGDKGIYKALTGAQKYLLMKTFNLPTGDDPELDEKESGKKDEVTQLQSIDGLFEKVDELNESTFREWDKWWTDYKHLYEKEGVKKVSERLETKRKILNASREA